MIGQLLAAGVLAASGVTHLVYAAAPADAGSAVARDGSGFGNDGRLRGGVVQSGGVYRFHPVAGDGRFDRIVAPDSASLSPGTRPFWYSARIRLRPDARFHHSGEMALVRHGDSGTPGGNYKMEIGQIRGPGGGIYAECIMHDADGQGAGFVRGTGGVVLNDWRWHRITCARVSAGVVSMTVDGRTVERAVRGSLGDVTGRARLLIGCQLARDGVHMMEQFVGRMDDIKIGVE